MAADKMSKPKKGSERRGAVRVDVADLKAVSGPPIRIQNLSSSGMLFSSSVAMKRGKSAKISLILPDREEPVDIHFVVERQDNNDSSVYRAIFVDLGEAEMAAIEHYVHHSLLVTTQAELIQRYPTLAEKNLHSIRNQDRIHDLLQARLRTRQPLVITAGDLKVQARVKLKSIESPRPLLKVVSVERLQFRLGVTLLLSLQSEKRSYLFESVVVETKGIHHTLLKPPVIFFADERFDLREPLAPGTLDAIIPLPYPPGAELRVPVLNRSEGGMALELPAETPVFNGTPVDGMRLEPTGDGPTEKMGPMVICHVSGHPRGEVGKVLVGMQYSLPRAPLQVGRWERKTGPCPAVQLSPPNGMHVSLLTPGGDASRGELHHGQQLRSRLIRWEDADGAEMVGRLDTTLGFKKDRPVPVIVIPPAAVKTKETVVGLAMTLVEGFASVGEEVAVLRYDGTYRRGESHNVHADNPFGQKMLSWTHSRAIGDMEAALAAVRSGEHATPSHLILVTFSAAGLEARYLLARGGGEVTLWVPILAVPEFREVSRRIYGGLDVGELSRLEMLPERLRALGEELHAEPYVQDAMDLGLAGMEQARQDMAAIPSPVYWIAGQDDGWVDFKQVQDLMTIRPKNGALRELFPVESGHQIRTSPHALKVFRMITDLALRHVAPLAHLPRFTLSPDEVEAASRREMERLNLDQVRDPVAYWHRYLLGSGGDDMGYDIMREADDFEDFMRQQAQLLCLEDGDVVADLGTGTGNLMEALLRHCLGGRAPSRLVLSDLVPSALDRAEQKARAALADHGLNVPVEAVVANLEHSRLRVVEEYLEGLLFGPLALQGRISGLGEKTLGQLAAGYGPLTHEVMRGHLAREDELDQLQNRHGETVVAHLLEFSKAARLVRGVTVDEDLKADRRGRPSGRPVRAGDLDLDLLNFGDAAPNERLPLPESAFDCIASSLVICYLNDPAEVVKSFRRMLRPGGRIVLSTPRPDMDISGIYVRMVEGITRRGGEDAMRLLESARTFSNSAALLLYLEEQGYFSLPDEDQLCRMMADAGFENIAVTHGLGTPSQAIIASGRVPAAAE